MKNELRYGARGEGDQEEATPDWPMVVKVVIFFAVVISARWWVPALIEWMMPK